MGPADLLRHLVEKLERLQLPYFVTGSMATIYFGEPRLTIDIDVVVDLPAHRVAEFCQAFPVEEYYLSEEAVLSAVKRRGQFNVIHPASGLKVDVMIPADSPFDRERFSRSLRMHPARDYEATFASPEDVILKKMEFYREGGSEKHLRDIAGILRVSGESIDRSYIDGWAGRLGLAEIWAAILVREDSTR